MNTEKQNDSSNDSLQSVKDVIRLIQTKSASGSYIHRGERKCYCKVSSSLYRELDIEAKHFDIEVVQKEMLTAAKKHTRHLHQDFAVFLNLSGQNTDETIDFEILAELQHYGGSTNLIAFTVSYYIALFFACDGAPGEDGRIILQRTEPIKDWIHRPRNPRHRVVAQKSVFVRPPKGFIEPDEDDIVIIPAALKISMLEYLQNYHGISTESIYNDLHGFIRDQRIHESAYMEFHSGFVCKDRAAIATTDEEKQREYEKSIAHYTQAIELKSGFSEAYYNRGNAYRQSGDFESAIKDYNAAIKLKSDYAEAYYQRGDMYTRKDDFENAIKDFNAAIKLKLDYAAVYCHRGTTYAKKGEIRKAITDLDKAIQLEPNLAEAYCNRGSAYQHIGELDKAIIDYDKAIQLIPNFADFYYNRGFAYLKKDEFDRAIGDYSKAIELHGDFAETNLNWGDAYRFDCANAYYYRGEARLHMQAWEKAKSDLTTARNMGIDIATVFHDSFENVENFEQITSTQLPEDIAALVILPQV